MFGNSQKKLWMKLLCLFLEDFLKENFARFLKEFLLESQKEFLEEFLWGIPILGGISGGFAENILGRIVLRRISKEILYSM